MLETVRYSTLTREQFKQTALKEGKTTHAQKEKRIKGFQRQKKDIGKDLDTIDVKIAQLETDKLLGRKPAKRINAQIKVLDGESKRLTVKKNEIDVQLRKLSDEKLWVDWYADYLQDADDRPEIEGEDRLEFIKKYVEQIEVHLDKDTLRHTLGIRFNLPIADLEHHSFTFFRTF